MLPANNSRRGRCTRLPTAAVSPSLTPAPPRVNALEDDSGARSLWPSSTVSRFVHLVCLIECAPAEAAEPVDGPSAHVLVAEDNPINQKVTTRTLEMLGCTVVLVSDESEAVRLVGEQPFDLVLMDCQMPVLDGFGAARAIRELQGDREECLAAGMNDYLSKPVRIDALASLVRRFVERRDLSA